ncbi:hypothetical protein I4U23_017175 [Adineta vaga]|nr:hypothetical protein I4U23_017175 [Adineta vaga]
MDTQRLRVILLDIQDHLSNEDRSRLHFYLGGVVPRRFRDDPSLTGTLNIMERLIEERRISEKDLTFLIDAFDQIHSFFVTKLLFLFVDIGHLRRIESKELNQSVRDISMIMPQDKLKLQSCSLNQGHICDHENSPRTNTKQSSCPLTVFRNWRLLLELLLYRVSQNQRIIYRYNITLGGTPNASYFSSGVVEKKYCNIVRDLRSTDEFVIKPEDALKADIQLTANSHYYLFTRKKSVLNVSGRKRLTAQVCRLPWNSDNNAKISAKLYIKTGPSWEWYGSGPVELNNNNATTLVLVLNQSPSENSTNVQEIGVEYTSTANGGRSNVHLSSIVVD